MKRGKLVSALLLTAIMVSSLAGCSGGEQAGGEETKRYDQLLVEGSTLGGIGYSLLSGMVEIATEVLPDVTLTLEATAGYKENAVRMSKGVGDIGIVGHDDAVELYNGVGEYGSVKETFLTMFPAHTLDWNIIVREDSGIKSIWDLKGKKVNKQPKGGASEAVSTILLDALNIEHQDFYMPHTEAAEAMMSNSIDAHIVMGAPAQFRELATRIPLVVIDLPDEDIELILKEMPYLTRTVFPAGLYYPGNSDIQTVNLWAPVLAHKDLPEDLIYKLVKGVYENIDTMKAAHPSGGDMKPEQVLEMNVPLHPGALKYFKEVGIDIPERLIKE
jgi:TRAP transporter TAXI family solute receptor